MLLFTACQEEEGFHLLTPHDSIDLKLLEEIEQKNEIFEVEKMSLEELNILLVDAGYDPYPKDYIESRKNLKASSLQCSRARNSILAVTACLGQRCCKWANSGSSTGYCDCESGSGSCVEYHHEQYNNDCGNDRYKYLLTGCDIVNLRQYLDMHYSDIGLGNSSSRKLCEIDDINSVTYTLADEQVISDAIFDLCPN